MTRHVQPVADACYIHFFR